VCLNDEIFCVIPSSVTRGSILEPFCFMLCLQHFILAVPMNSGVLMADAYSNHGSVIMKTTAEMVQMNWIVTIRHVLRKNLHVLIIAVYQCHRCA
jgi:hypothetical protein